MTRRWCHDIAMQIGAAGPGSIIVTFPTYRPDLVVELADALALPFVDFRAVYLAPLGFAAHTLPLTVIEAAIADRADTRGLVLHNAEALLAAKPAADRQAWLAAFLDMPRSATVLLPLALFGPDLGDHPRLIRLAEAAVPPESLLMQLASLRVT